MGAIPSAGVAGVDKVKGAEGFSDRRPGTDQRSSVVRGPPQHLKTLG